ncbi:hypothetical protein K2W90_05575 [Candidatus Babeliales bacterium]|nr:hypothetical protein [Candidatus Babeliales bacterium]
MDSSTIKNSFDQKLDPLKESLKKKPLPSLNFSAHQISSHLLKLTIDVHPQVTECLYDQTIELFKGKNLDGFDKAEIPSAYVEESFKNEINKKIKNYLFKHLIIDHLMTEILARKILMANYPRLNKITFNPDHSISFVFDISIADPIPFKEWKHFSFKSPKRKKYKDLDKQVVQFMDKETISERKQNHSLIEEGDWVCFQTTLFNKKNEQVSKNLVSTFWIKIKTHEVCDPLGTLFLGKNINDSFITNHLEIDDSINDYENYRYDFLVKINSIIKGTNLSLDCFKSAFKLKNKTEIHNKLMEVFSYRNDQSQRKSIIEEIFHLFLTKHRFEIPKHLILRRQEDILLSLTQQPDYQVYKAQKDFGDHIEQLAEKQLKEEILVDQIAYNENIKIELKDMQHYLHLFNSKRLREFVYFKPLIEKIDIVNTPINTGLLAQTVMREKTLNHIIHVLTH